MMETLHAASAVLSDWLLETSVHVAVLFALVLGASVLMGKRLPARWRYSLWGLVLLRLLLPAIPASPASVHNVARFVAPQAQVRVEPVAPRIAPVGDAPVAQLVPSAAVAPVTSEAPSWPWRSAVVLLWAVGALLALGRLLFTEARFARRVRREAVHGGPRVTAALTDALRAAGVRRRVEVVRTDLGDGPALTGLWRPRILVPGRVLDGLSDDELRHVLAHEVAHLAAGDVLQNWVLAVLEAVHWFNPFVRVAAARVRTERETLRDLAATRGAPQEGRAAYGRTLLRLLETGARRSSAPMAVGLFERRGDLRRRIEMIAKGGGGRRAWVMGAGLTAAVAVVALTGASPGDVRAHEDEGKTPAAQPLKASGSLTNVTWEKASLAIQESKPRIEVVRRSEPPEWESRVEAALAKTTTLNLNETTVVDLLEYMSRITELNFVIHPDAQQDAATSAITLSLEKVSCKQALRLSLAQVEMTYGVVDGVLHVGHYHRIRPTLDQRFYKVAPLIEATVARIAERSADGGVGERLRQSMPEDLIALCQNYVADQDSWCREGVSMAAWDDVLVVEQDPAAHEAMEAFLNMLLARGAAVPPAPAWRTALEAKLAKKVSFDFKEAPLSDVVAYLAQSTEASIVVAPEMADDVVLSLKLADVTAMEAVNWVARQARLHAAFADGAVVLTRSPPVVIRLYDLSAKFSGEDGVPADQLIELIVSSVEPVTWEEFGSVEYWEEMLIVRNTESVHAKITEFLEVARRAREK